jgi:hypothetical protein
MIPRETSEGVAVVCTVPTGHRDTLGNPCGEGMTAFEWICLTDNPAISSGLVGRSASESDTRLRRAAPGMWHNPASQTRLTRAFEEASGGSERHV